MITGLLLLALAALSLLCIAGRIGTGTWVNKLLMAADILVCTLIWGGFGVTISSRCGIYLQRAAGPYVWMHLGALLNKLKPGHCAWAIEHDIQRADAAKSFLSNTQGTTK